jgi:quinol monooxygenase YgiN
MRPITIIFISTWADAAAFAAKRQKTNMAAFAAERKKGMRRLLSVIRLGNVISTP